MSTDRRLLAVIPARGGSKGLPGKNLRPFAGHPLVVHSLLFAAMCPEIERTIVSTDSEEIADLARKSGADVPFLRPHELAGDDTPMWPVLKHALVTVEEAEANSYDALLLLDPTSPAREPGDVRDAWNTLLGSEDADGIIGVSQPDFNPIWHSVVEKDGWMTPLIPEGADYQRRQDVPSVYRINGALYMWRAEFVRSATESWREGRHLMQVMPDNRSMSIDDEDEFLRAELLVRSGIVRLPWLEADRS